MVLSPAIAISYPSKFDYKILIKFLSSFSCEVFSITGGIISALLLYQNKGVTFSNAKNIVQLLLQDKNSSPIYFSCRINPESVDEVLNKYLQMFTQLENVSNESDGVKVIVSTMSKVTGNNVVRPTLDHPLCSLAYAILLTQFCKNDIAIYSARKGGVSNIIASLCTAFSFSSISNIFSVFSKRTKRPGRCLIMS